MLFRLLFLAIFIVMLIMVRKQFLVAFRATPLFTKKISALIFIVGLIALEGLLRLNGALPYFTIQNQENITNLIPIDSIEDMQQMVCDSFGVNKFNIHPKFNFVSPINADGFHSFYEFSQSSIDSIHQQQKKAILIVGDSYTYGASADSGYSFAYVIEHSGKYGVLNAGIPGTDAAQYEAVVNEYIVNKKIHPDRVLVCINAANDLYHFVERKLTPGIPILYATNIGGIYSYQGDEHIFSNAKEAYKNILSQYTIIGIIGDGWFTRLIGNSVVISRMIGLFRISKEQKQAQKELTTSDPILTYIKGIRNDCTVANIPVVFLLLPGKEAAKTKKMPSLEGVISLKTQCLTLDDYANGADDHPNNNGHKKIAEQIIDILEHN